MRGHLRTLRIAATPPHPICSPARANRPLPAGGARYNASCEIDNLIGELRLLREKLLADGNRVERDIVEYAALSQSVIEMTKIITESMQQVKKLPGAPTLTP